MCKQQKYTSQLCMVVYMYNCSTKEAESEGSGVQGQPWLQEEIPAIKCVLYISNSSES